MDDATSAGAGDGKRQRLEFLFFYGPICVLLFGVAGGYLVIVQWGLGNPLVLGGGACGLVPVVALTVMAARRWNHRLTTSELRRSRAAIWGGAPPPDSDGLRDDSEVSRSDSKVLRTVGAWTLPAIGLNAAFGFVGGAPFPTAFFWTFCSGCTVLAYVAVIARRGLYQRDPAAARAADAEEHARPPR